MDKIFNLGSVDQYHKLYGFETLNPLVSASDRNGKGTYGRYRGYRQPDCLFAGIPIPAALLSSVQKEGGVHS